MSIGVKDAKRLARHFKGAANHWRVEILLQVAKKPNITLEGLWTALKATQKTISEHTKVLTDSGLIDKRYKGTNVQHTLSPRGKDFCLLLEKLR